MTSGAGNAGRITVSADHMLVDGQSVEGFTGLSSGTNPGSSGDGRPVQVTVDGTLDLRRGGQIDSSTVGSGNAGAVRVDAERILMSTGVAITSRADEGSTGRAGTVRVTAGELLSISDGSSVNSAALGDGDGGEVFVEAERLEILSGSEVASVTSGAGNAGRIAVHAGQMLVDGRNVQAFTGISSGTNPGSSGDGRPVQVTVDGTLDLRRSGQIDSSTAGEGDAGSVIVEAGQLRIFDGLVLFTGIFSEALEGSAGDGGRVTVTAARLLEIHDEGVISSSSKSIGDAGRVAVNAGDLVIDGSGSSGQFPTGITSTGEASGRAGGVSIQADRVLMDGGSISTDSAEAGGGEINLLVEKVIDLHESAITTSVGGGEDETAGNITLDSEILVIDSGRMQANAPEGIGGRVVIDADSVVVRGGDFDAPLESEDISATGGTSERAGTVAVDASELNLAGDLVVLQAPLLDAAALLRRPCGARQDVGASSFTAAGPGGLPAGPNAPLRSAYSGAQASSAPVAGGPVLQLAGCADAGDASPG